MTELCDSCSQRPIYETREAADIVAGLCFECFCGETAYFNLSSEEIEELKKNGPQPEAKTSGRLEQLREHRFRLAIRARTLVVAGWTRDKTYNDRDWISPTGIRHRGLYDAYEAMNKAGVQ
jgi:hypothetical protein